jgi:hypothetical protein
MKYLTALQYQKLLLDLPNPLSVLREGNAMIQLNYLIDPNSNDTFLFGQKNSFGENLTNLAKVETITFQLVTESQIPYWEPKESLMITPVTDKDVNYTRYFR